MTKRDYIRAVNLIKELDKKFEFRTPQDRKQVVDIFATFFESDNPRFNYDRFMKAMEKK